MTAAQRPTVERAPERHREGLVPGPTKEALEAGAAGPTEWRHGPVDPPATIERGSSEGASYTTIPEPRLWPTHMPGATGAQRTERRAWATGGAAEHRFFRVTPGGEHHPQRNGGGDAEGCGAT